MNNAPNIARVTSDGLELANRLEQLLQLPLCSESDIEPWSVACGEVQEWLWKHDRELPPKFPYRLIPYFNDPDIRAKEPDYKERQEQAVRHIIRQLRGEVALDIPRPWWRFW